MIRRDFINVGANKYHRTSSTSCLNTLQPIENTRILVIITSTCIIVVIIAIIGIVAVGHEDLLHVEDNEEDRAWANEELMGSIINILITILETTIKTKTINLKLPGQQNQRH